MNTHIPVVVRACCLAAVFAGTAFAQGSVREGKWEVSMATKMDAMPGMANTYTATSCITSQNPYPDAQGMQGCQIPKVQWEGNTVYYEVNCDKDGTQIAIKSHMTYNGDTLTGESSSHMVAQGQAMDATTTFTGKYVGACD